MVVLGLEALPPPPAALRYTGAVVGRGQRRKRLTIETARGRHFMVWACPTARAAWRCWRRCVAPQSATRSINVESLAGAFELLTRFDTGQRCNTSSAAGRSTSRPALPSSHRSKSLTASRTGMRSCTSATTLLGPVISIVQDLSAKPVARSRHSSHSPAIVRAGEPSRVVKY